MADIIQTLNVDGNVYDISTTWEKVTGKPDTFPAETHTHDYLPFSGGTITGSLTVNGSISVGDTLILRGHYLFTRNNNNAEWIVTDKNWQHEYSLYHSGNFNPTNYLPLSGGTVTGQTIFSKTGSNDNSALVVGGSKTDINISVADQTSMLQIVAGSGGSTNSSAIGFHNPNVSSAVLEYKNTNANTGYFNFRSDNTNWAVKVNGTNVSLDGHTHSYVDSAGTATYASYLGDSSSYYTKSSLDNALSSRLWAGRTRNPSDGTSWTGAIPFILALKSAGTPVYDDPEFRDGENNCRVYNNYGNGSVSTSRISDDQNSGNSSGYILKIYNNGGSATPGLGGFYQNISARAGAVFAQIFRAKIPEGYYLSNAENHMGDGYTTYWLTDVWGTGKWEWYCRVTICGTSGTMSNGGHVYLNGTGPVTWYLSYCNVIDLSKGDYDGLKAKYADYAISAGSASSATNAAYATSAGNANTVGGYGAGSFAFIGNPNNMMHSGNEYTYAADGYSGDIWHNYRTAAWSTNGSIANYRFGNGATGYAAVVASAFYQSSDERLKTFYDPIKVDLEKLKRLRKNYFKFNDKDKLEVGVSAQEIQSLYPEIVSTDDNGYLSVAYDKLSVIALAALDEQQDIIEDQNNKINQLEERLKTIENILKEKGIL